MLCDWPNSSGQRSLKAEACTVEWALSTRIPRRLPGTAIPTRTRSKQTEGRPVFMRKRAQVADVAAGSGERGPDPGSASV